MGNYIPFIWTIIPNPNNGGFDIEKLFTHENFGLDFRLLNTSRMPNPKKPGFDVEIGLGMKVLVWISAF